MFELKSKHHERGRRKREGEKQTEEEAKEDGQRQGQQARAVDG